MLLLDVGQFGFGLLNLLFRRAERIGERFVLQTIDDKLLHGMFECGGNARATDCQARILTLHYVNGPEKFVRPNMQIETGSSDSRDLYFFRGESLGK